MLFRSSGSAALSAARKRRASSTQMGGGNNGANVSASFNSLSQSASYYGGSKQTLQGIMNQNPISYHGDVAQTPAFVLPKEQAPNVPINIYENIELIKKQLSDRTKFIQTQGTAIPADKLRVLQKQNEIQTQFLYFELLLVRHPASALPKYYLKYIQVLSY